MNLHQKYSQALRNTAERHPDDLIANAASAVAVKLETLGTPWGTQSEDITDTDHSIMQYAEQWNGSTEHQQQMEKLNPRSRRNVLKNR